MISVSIGGATFPEDGTSSEDLLVRADERLYRAKREGKNRVIFR
jgi:diguanylate cyclase (GGDEF)-like protein